MYIDATQSFVYESSLMSENQLPPVYVRKGHKRHRIDSYSMLACYTVFVLTHTLTVYIIRSVVRLSGLFSSLT